MPKMVFELTVEMDDEHTWTVVADQRDCAKFEVQPFGFPMMKIEDRASIMAMRFLAWSASTRQQLTSLAWPDFDARCVEVMPVDEEEGAIPADAEDPGQPAPSDTPT